MTSVRRAAYAIGFAMSALAFAPLHATAQEDTPPPVEPPSEAPDAGDVPEGQEAPDGQEVPDGQESPDGQGDQENPEGEGTSEGEGAPVDGSEPPVDDTAIAEDVDDVVQDADQIEDLDLAALLGIVEGASRQLESIGDAPASVVVITRDEIRIFGYQTIAEAIAMTRGIYMTSDRVWNYVGGLRGASINLDFDTRNLATEDGHTLNDPTIGFASVWGHEGRVDLLDGERIEIIRGPGSVLYGSNAFYGVINYVTHNLERIPPLHASIASDSLGSVRVRAGGGHRFSNDAGFWLSAGGLYSHGEDLAYPDRPALGLQVGADEMNAQSARARAWLGDFRLDLSFRRYRKRIPNGVFITTVGDPRSHVGALFGWGDLQWNPQLTDEVSLLARVYFDAGEHPMQFGLGTTTLSSTYRSAQIGGEVRTVIQIPDWLRVTVGAESRGVPYNNLFLEVQEPGVTEVAQDTDVRYAAFAGYALANVTPIRELSIDVGLRYDFFTTFADGAFSPRGAVIVRPWTGGVLKVLGGSAFRAPSTYQLYGLIPGVRAPPEPDSLAPERIWNAEVELTHQFDEEWAVTGDVYYSLVENLIYPAPTPGDPGSVTFLNTTDLVHTLGGEAEVRREFRDGWMLVGSYAYQRSRIGNLSDSDLALVPNQPEHIWSFRVAAPLAPEVATLAFRTRVESPRRAVRIDSATGTPRWLDGDWPVLADITLSGRFAALHLEYALGVRNLFDWQYSHPIDPVSSAEPFVVQRRRTFFIQATISYD